jgi:regulator of sigma E protease
VIVLAGPAMNILFPVLLYTSVFLEDKTLLPPTVGVVLPGEPGDGKLMPGDRILSVDGREVASFPEVQRIVAGEAGKTLKLAIVREGKTLDITVTPADKIEERELDMVEHVGQIGIRPSFPAAVIGVPRTDSPAFRAKLKTFDKIVAINGRKLERFKDLVDALSENRGDTVVLTYLRPIAAPEAMGGLCDLAVMEPGVAQLTPNAKTSMANTDDFASRAADVLERTGIESSDMYVSFVPEGSAEWMAGLRVGDRITTLDGAPARLWRTMDAQLKADKGRQHAITWTRGGEALSGTFHLRTEEWNDEYEQHYERYRFHTTHWLPDAPNLTVPNPHPLVYAVRRAVEETGSVVKLISVGFVRLVQGRVSLASVSGPITIYDIAGSAGAKGRNEFLEVMAIISVNLGLINLLPIPVLDGGHFFFFLVEWVRRRPLSLRVREVASLVGMSVLVLLMLIAFKNDVSRRWGDIVGQIREIFS